jgi:23S rRNA pseudouridine1911/1915/1917 synthase
VSRALEAEGRSASINEVRRALKDGRITIAGRRASPGLRAEGGESVELDRFVPRVEATIDPEPELAVTVRVIEDGGDVLVLDKPAGMPTQPLMPLERGTLLGVAVAVAPEIASAGPPLEGGLAHRLDVDTSGVVVFAKTAAARERLRRSFSGHRISKRYLACVTDRGSLVDPRVVRGAIAPSGPRVRVLDPEDGRGEEARTEVRPLRRVSAERVIVEIVTRFGRRHQVRAHLASIGAPIVGDLLYGGEPNGRLLLHAHQIELEDGRVFTAPPPPELEP